MGSERMKTENVFKKIKKMTDSDLEGLRIKTWNKALDLLNMNKGLMDMRKFISVSSDTLFTVQIKLKEAMTLFEHVQTEQKNRKEAKSNGKRN